MTRPDDRRAARLLLLGVVAGVGLTAWSLLGRPLRSAGIPEGAVAIVNGKTISRQAFERYAVALQAERGPAAPGSDAQRALLQRMIEEELLVQRGVELGVARLEPKARQAIVSTMALVITGAASASEVSEDALLRFHAEHPERFARDDGFVLGAVLVAVGPATEASAYREAAARGHAAREGTQLDPLGDGPLSRSELAARFGARAAEVVAGLAAGEVSFPVRTPEGWAAFELRERQAGAPLPLDEVRDRVRVELLRERSDRALERYVRDLVNTADIRVLDPALAP